MLVADVAHFPRANEIIQGAQRLVDRDLRVGAMELVEINIVGLKALQGGVTLLDDMTSIIAGRQDIIFVHTAVDLGRQHNPMAFAVALQRLADHCFAAAARIDVGGIEEVDAGLNGAVHDVETLGLRRGMTEVHAAQAELADHDAGAA